MEQGEIKAIITVSYGPKLLLTSPVHAAKSRTVNINEIRSKTIGWGPSKTTSIKWWKKNPAPLNIFRGCTNSLVTT